jgi:hypothetical protein
MLSMVRCSRNCNQQRIERSDIMTKASRMIKAPKPPPDYAVHIKALQRKAKAIVRDVDESIKEGIKEIKGPRFNVRSNALKTALKTWELELEDAVFRKLLKDGRWDDDAMGKGDKERVLQVAVDMGRIAAILSGMKKNKVSVNQINGAFKAVKSHVICPGRGSGAWCDFK